jgi:hypothetical protein
VGETWRPNGATLYGLEDIRGYESIVLDRFADTFLLWCRSQPASFNRVDDLERPFLGFLGARYALLSPGAKIPKGWDPVISGPEMSIARNPNALPRVFVPQTLRYQPDSVATLSEMRDAADFSKAAWIASSAAARSEPNGTATLAIRESGPDLVVSVDARQRVFLATSLPDWPGWVAAREDGGKLSTETVNHAFVGLWLPPGKTSVRLRYRPASYLLGLAASCVGLALTAGAVWKRSPRKTLR